MSVSELLKSICNITCQINIKHFEMMKTEHRIFLVRLAEFLKRNVCPRTLLLRC